MAVAVISGASRGIGAAIAEHLGRAGWDLGLLARTPADLEVLQAQLAGICGARTKAISCDIADEAAVQSAIEDIEQNLGPIELTVCNAGVGKFQSASSFSSADWDQQMNINARGSFLLAKESSLRMATRQRGHVVFISSDAATRTFANGSVYCASKYAQYAFAAALRKELRPSGIKVSVVMPGLVASYFNDGSPDSPSRAQWLKPEDVASAVLYVVSAPANVVVDEIVLHPITQDW